MCSHQKHLLQDSQFKMTQLKIFKKSARDGVFNRLNSSNQLETVVISSWERWSFPARNVQPACQLLCLEDIAVIYWLLMGFNLLFSSVSLSQCFDLCLYTRDVLRVDLKVKRSAGTSTANLTWDCTTGKETRHISCIQRVTSRSKLKVPFQSPLCQEDLLAVITVVDLVA